MAINYENHEFKAWQQSLRREDIPWGRSRILWRGVRIRERWRRDKLLKSGMSETPFPGLSGWIWGKKGGLTEPIESPSPSPPSLEPPLIPLSCVTVGKCPAPFLFRLLSFCGNHGYIGAPNNVRHLPQRYFIQRQWQEHYIYHSAALACLAPGPGLQPYRWSMHLYSVPGIIPGNILWVSRHRENTYLTILLLCVAVFLGGSRSKIPLRAL